MPFIRVTPELPLMARNVNNDAQMCSTQTCSMQTKGLQKSQDEHNKTGADAWTADGGGRGEGMFGERMQEDSECRTHSSE